MGLRIVSYNIRKAVGLDWRRHPHRTLDVLKALEPDIVVLQEADRRLGPRPAALPHHLIDAETDLVAAPLAPNDVSLGWHGNAVLLRRGLEASGCEHIELPGLEPRGAVLARVRRNRDEIAVIGVHLGLLRGWRRRQLAAVRRHLSDAEAALTLIAGDFNEWSSDLGLEPLSGAFEVISPGRTFHASRPAAALDKFAHGRRIHPVACGVDDSPLARRSSDHLPIWIDVEVVAPADADGTAGNERGRRKAGPEA